MISIEHAYQHINATRHKHLITPVRWDNTLAELALQRAVSIYERRNEKPTTKGYGFSLLGENVAERYRNSDNMIQAWKKSPVTNNNLLLPTYTDIGIATYGNTTVALFGTRL